MELKAAFPKTIPVLAGYLFLGITYGILAVTSGLPAWMPVLTALVVYTGSMKILSGCDLPDFNASVPDSESLSVNYAAFA